MGHQLTVGPTFLVLLRARTAAWLPLETSVLVDPDDHRTAWAGVEIDGVFRSLDEGETWTHVEASLYDPDVHAMTIAGTRPKRVFASTIREVFASVYLGEQKALYQEPS